MLYIYKRISLPLYSPVTEQELWRLYYVIIHDVLGEPAAAMATATASTPQQ
jgi:hypothetical protein